MLDLTELNKLEDYLRKNNISFERTDNYYEFEPDGFHQIRVVNAQGDVLWDAVCHNFSYGHESGLLETYGLFDYGDDVLGWLSADDIITRLNVHKNKVYTYHHHKTNNYNHEEDEDEEENSTDVRFGESKS